MKKFFLIISLIISLGSFAQEISVADAVTRFGIEGVKIFCKDSEDTLETNGNGNVNIDIFPDNKPIVFQHPFYETVIFTKKQLERRNWLVLMPRGPQLLYAELSLLNAREYSFGLPFYIKIINMDNPLTFEDYDHDASQKIMFKTDEKGVTVFRSLQANKIILALDGMRLNNEIYKNGKIENAYNFDNTITQTVQQIYNSTYLIYHPDGLGGVIHYFTKIPALSDSYKPIIHFSTTHRIESATRSWVSNYQLSFAKNKYSSFTSVTYSNYGDIESGHNRRSLPTDDSTYGLHLFYVDRINGRDTILPNPDPYRQIGTGYKQLFILQKFRYKIKSRVFLFSNYYYTKTSNQGIYSGLTEINGDHPRFARCEYFPTQKFITNNYIYIQRKNIFFNFASIGGSFHYIEEYRYTRKYRNPVGLHQIERLKVGHINADMVKVFRLSRLAYGMEYKYNFLKSRAFFENIETDSTWPGLTRYPTGGTQAHWFSIYAHYRNLANSRFIIDLATRIDYHIISAHFSNKPPQLPLNFTRIDKRYFSPSAALAFDAYPIPGWESKLTLSYNTHTPIVDDFGKVMFKDFITMIPTDKLTQERTYYSEWANSITPSSFLRLQFSVFNTYFKNMIILKDTVLNGLDSIYFGPDGYNLAAKTNLPKALIYGFSASLNINLPLNTSIINYIKFSSIFNYTRGLNLTDSLPIPNISPYFGKNNIQIRFNRPYTLTISHLYTGGKPLNELSPVGEDYIEKASAQGFLPWQIFNIRLDYQKKNISIYLAINNILDTFYRPYASAINGTGRNFIGGIKFSF